MKFHPLLAFLIFLLPIVSDAHSQVFRFYLGTYTRNSPSEGIYTALLDADTGRIHDLKLAAPAENPNFLARSPDGRFLYACDAGKITAFATSPAGVLRRINTQPTGGEGVCHVSLDAAGRQVFAANYSSGSATVFPVHADGSLEEATDFVAFEGSGPNLKRQKESHAHSAYSSRDGRFFYVCDLGTDKVETFRLQEGKIAPLTPGIVPPGSGPRHLAFSGDERFVYVCNELSQTVTVFSRDAETGLLSALQTLPLLPDSAAPIDSTTAAIELHPSGRWLYVSTRGHEIISILNVAQDGMLTVAQNVPSVVRKPRGFALDPGGRWLVVAGQDDHQVRVFSIDQSNGSLKALPDTIKVGAPVSVLFAPDQTKL